MNISHSVLFTYTYLHARDWRNPGLLAESEVSVKKIRRKEFLRRGMGAGIRWYCEEGGGELGDEGTAAIQGVMCAGLSQLPQPR